MDYLEKVFLFSLAISFLTIMFMFALYFDVGDMIYGRIRRSTAFETAIAEQAVSLLEFRYRTRDSAAARALRLHIDRNEDYGLPETQDEFVAACKAPALSRHDLVALKRAELKRMGFTSKAFIEMESYNKDRVLYHETMDAVDQAMSQSDYSRAVDLLERAIAATPDESLYVLRDLWSRLMSVYTMAHRIDEARQATFRYLDLKERILKAKEAAGIKVDVREWQQLTKVRKSVEPYFKKLGALPGGLRNFAKTPDLSPAERLKGRQRLEEAYRQGKLSREEYEKIKADMEI